MKNKQMHHTLSNHVVWKQGMLPTVLMPATDGPEFLRCSCCLALTSLVVTDCGAVAILAVIIDVDGAMFKVWESGSVVVFIPCRRFACTLLYKMNIRFKSKFSGYIIRGCKSKVNIHFTADFRYTGSKVFDETFEHFLLCHPGLQQHWDH